MSFYVSKVRLSLDSVEQPKLSKLNRTTLTLDTQNDIHLISKRVLVADEDSLSDRSY